MGGPHQAVKVCKQVSRIGVREGAKLINRDLEFLNTRIHAKTFPHMLRNKRSLERTAAQTRIARKKLEILARNLACGLQESPFDRETGHGNEWNDTSQIQIIREMV
jgi:hypothetical protein